VARALEDLHAADAVRVIEDRRGADRRRADRREAQPAAPGDDRRTIHGFDGRRVADRRAAMVAVDAPRSLTALEDHAESVSYARRIAPAEREVAEAELARLLLRVQGGEQDAIEKIYRLMFDDVFAYLNVTLGDRSDAEATTQQVFLSVLTALPGFRLRRGTTVRAWVLSIARHQAIKHRKRPGRQVVVEVSDPELRACIERLPFSQRQVLALRNMLGMDTNEIAIVLDRTSQAVRHLEARALRSVRERLEAIGRGRSQAHRIAA
jgi:RNA polymerase sigma-70 factor (ECF subfamily)